MSGSLIRTFNDVVRLQPQIDAAEGVERGQVALTDAANIAWDLAAAPNAIVTLAGNRTLDNPTNGVPGKIYTLKVTQDGTGSRTLLYGTAYKWIGGTDAVLTITAAAQDVLVFLYDGTNMNAIIVGLAMAD